MLEILVRTAPVGKPHHTCPSICCSTAALSVQVVEDRPGLALSTTALKLMTSWEPAPGAAMLVVCFPMHNECKLVDG